MDTYYLTSKTKPPTMIFHNYSIEWEPHLDFPNTYITKTILSEDIMVQIVHNRFPNSASYLLSKKALRFRIDPDSYGYLP